MIYNVDYQLQVFLLLAQLRIPTSARVLMVQFCRFKIRMAFQQLANAMSKHGQRLLKLRGRSENVCCFFARPIFAEMM